MDSKITSHICAYVYLHNKLAVGETKYIFQKALLMYKSDFFKAKETIALAVSLMTLSWLLSPALNTGTVHCSNYM